MRIPGNYTAVDTLHTGRSTWIARAKRFDSAQPVILKGLRGDFPDSAATARIRHEFAILQVLAEAGAKRVVLARALVGDASHPTLELPDHGGKAVGQLLTQAGGQLPLAEVLRLGHETALALAEIHAAHVIHRDIKPSNVVLAADGKVLLIDFGVASLLQRWGQDTAANLQLVGTLSYLPPEQSGRMVRQVDERSDLYALGATLYELATGRLPFTATDPLALLHAHLALPPTPPEALRPEIPPTLSRIMMTLLAKSPDDRYQTARGLAADLEVCWAALRPGATPAAVQAAEALQLRCADVPDRFKIPTGFYGRRAELETLELALQRALTRPAPEVALVRGFAGVGKTALIRELRPTVHQLGGHIVMGKQDAVQRATPFAALRVAFSDLAAQWLALPDATLQPLLLSLKAALGPNIGLAVQFSPAWEPLLGPGEAPAELPADAARYRFEDMLLTVIRQAAAPGRPLVMVLDDLQWADPGTLQWLGRLMAEPELPGLLMVLSWRANEVDSTHPLSLLLTTLHDRTLASPARERPTQLDLGGLDEEATLQLIAATVHRPTTEVTALAGLVQQKTAGNPFFVRLFLERIEQKGLLRFDNGWQWDLPAIVSADITDNVVDLLTGALADLAPATAHALGVAAALDSQPTLADVAGALDCTPQETWTLLWPAVLAGFLTPQSQTTSTDTPPPATRLRFQHDRVQQAAYEAIAPADRAALHAGIVKRALAATGAAAAVLGGKGVVALADHALLALPAIQDADMRVALGRLLVTAGHQARAAVAYDRALHYLSQGLAQCEQSLTQAERFRAVVDRYVCEFLTRQWAEAEARFAELQRLAPTVLDRVEAMDLRVGLLAAQGSHADAMEVVREALQLLGEKLPQKASQLTVIGEVVRVKMALGRRKPADVAQLPETTNAKAALILRLLNSAASSSFFLDTNLYTVVVLRMCRTMLAHGVTAAAPYCWACYAMICGPILGDFQAAAEFSKAARALQGRFGAVQQVSRLSLLLDGLVDPWNQHPAACIERLQEGVRAGGHAGDPLHAAFCSNQITYLKLLAGAPLAELLRDSQLYEGFSRRQGLTDSPETFPVTARFCELLMGEDELPESLAGDSAADAEWQTKLRSKDLILPIHLYHIANGFMNLLVGRHAVAIRWIQAGAQWTDKSVATGYSSLAPLTLALAALFRANDAPEYRAEGLAVAKKPAALLAKWAKANPDGFGHRLALIEAERARAKGDAGKAAVLYEQAVAGAGKQDYAHDEGLACLRAAQFFAAQGNQRVAQIYRRGAIRAWERWGASALAAHLRATFAELRTESPAVSHTGTTDRTSTSTISSRLASTSDDGSGTPSLDLTTVLRAAEALSREIRLDALVDKLLHLLIESAGARRALLLLADKKGTLNVAGEIVAGSGPPQVLSGAPVADRTDVAHTLVRIAMRTGLPAESAAQGVRDAYIVRCGVKSAIAVPIAAGGQVRGVVYLENELVEGAFPPGRVALLEALSGQMAISIENAELYRDLGSQATAFRRFVPEQFLTFLGHQDIRSVALGDAVEREMTVLFSDVRGFTAFSESRSPGEVFHALNRWLGVLGPLVRSHGGFIDKFIGDAVMGLFPGDPVQAVLAAVEMQRGVVELNRIQAERGDPPLKVGIGIHVGRLALGVLGEHERRETTVIGDAVNTAARLESLTKRLGAAILVSEAVHLLLPPTVARRPLGAFAVAGRRQAVQVFEVVDYHQPAVTEQLLSVAPQVLAALESAERGDTETALAGALQVLAVAPDDQVASALHRSLSAV